jgi:hypothetical protein
MQHRNVVSHITYDANGLSQIEFTSRPDLVRSQHTVHCISQLSAALHHCRVRVQMALSTAPVLRFVPNGPERHVKQKAR